LKIKDSAKPAQSFFCATWQIIAIEF
jgi:hypothetical protein